MENRKGYLKFIAYLQIIGIILVVAGHSIHEYPGVAEGNTPLFYSIFLTFRMPLFMFVSGFLMVYTTWLRKEKTPPSWRRFAKGKVLRLLLPFFVLTMVTFIPRALFTGMADHKSDFSILGLGKSLVFHSELQIPYFWFLQASFILLVFCYGFISLCGRYRVSPLASHMALILLFLALPYFEISFGDFFSLDKVVSLGIYFVLGAAYCRYANRVDTILGVDHWPMMFAYMALWLFFMFGANWRGSDMLCTLCGILMCICIAKALERYKIGVLDHLMGANYMIFLLSWYCNVLTQQVLAHFTDFPWWVYSALSLISGIYVPWLGYRYLQRHPDSRWVRLTAWLLGQRIAKQKSKQNC